MTETVNKAKTHLSKLVDQVSTGKEVVIAKSGKPLAKLVPLKAAKCQRKPGFLKGKMRVARDFDAVLPKDAMDSFTGAT